MISDPPHCLGEFFNLCLTPCVLIQDEVAEEEPVKVSEGLEGASLDDDKDEL